MFAAFGTLNMSDCSFEENFARSSGEKKDYITYSGGGMSICSFCVATLTNCTFVGNQSLASSGGISIYDNADITLRNCTFIGNTAQDSGGAISSGNSNKVRLVGCISMANSALNGNTLTCSSSHDDRLPSEVEMINCIIRDVEGKIWNDDDSLITITYSNVRGNWPGDGNIDADPLFAGPANNDYHLKSQAGRWDPGSDTWVQDDVTSPCIDAGDPDSAIGLEPFPNGGVINMGAYGGRSQASKSYFGEPVCQTIVAGDINGDCKVDYRDFVLLATHWLEDNNP